LIIKPNASEVFSKKIKKYLVEIKKPFPLHSQSKNGVLVKRQKIFESWETIALLSEAIREENK